MIIRPSTWKSFIKNHPSAEAANKAFPTIIAAFSQEKSIDDCINAALGLSPCVFLVFPMDAPHRRFRRHHNTKVMTFHHIVCLSSLVVLPTRMNI
jgi:hypothetical protein